MGKQQSTSGNAGGRQGRSSGRKRRRWLRRLAVLVGVLVVLVALAPYIVSTGPVTSLLTYAANGQIRGSVRMADLSLGWGGPSRIEGLSITDEQGREVLRAESISVAGGLWRFITSAEDFGRIELASPRVELYVTPEGKTSLEEALSSHKRPRKRKPRRKKKPSPLPKPAGEVLLRDAVVRVVLPSGREYGLSGLDGSVDVSTLDSIAGQLRMNLAAGGAVSVGFKLTGMAGTYELRPEQVSGSVVVLTERPVELGPLARFAGGPAPLEARAELNLDVSLDRGRAQSEIDLRVAGLQAGGERSRDLVPVDLGVAGTVNTGPEKISGELTLTAPRSLLKMGFAYRPGGKPVEVSLNDLVNAALYGEPIRLPDFEFTPSGKLDLGPLARALPSLMGIRPDVTVTQAELDIKDVTLRGGETPSAKGSIVLANVTGVKGEKTFTWRPITVNFDAELDGDEGLRVKDTAVRAGFAEVTIEGAASELEGRYTVQLAAMKQQLAQVFELGDLRLEGEASGLVKVTGAGRERTDLQFTAELRKLVYERAGRKLAADTASVVSRGYLLRKKEGSRLFNEKTDLALDEDLSLAAAGGWCDLSGGAFEFKEIQVARAAVAALARRAEEMGYEQAAGWSGSAAGSISAGRSSARDPVVSSGNLTVVGLSRHGRPISDKDVRAVWTDVKVELEERSLSAAKLTLRSGPANATVTELRAAFGERFALDGEVIVDAELADSIDAYRSFARSGGEPEKAPPDIAGKLHWEGKARTDAGGVSLDGNGNIADFQVGSVSEPRIGFDQRVHIDREGEVITFRQLDLKSELVSFELDEGGTIRRYTTQGVLGLSGEFDADWDRLTDLLHQFAPKLEQDVAIRGRAKGAFTLTGPINQPELKPVFYGAAGGTSVPWQTAMLFGIEAGAAEFRPELKEGQVIIPVAEIDASGGKMRLGGAVDMRAGEPVVKLPGETVILEELAVDPQVARKLLSRFNPIFGDAVSIKGKVTLATGRPIVLPMRPESELPAGGSGVLDLSGLEVEPKGLLAELLAMVGLRGDESRRMQIGSVDFRIEEDRRIWYDNFTVTFGEDLDLKFSGSVGLDDTVDLAVSVPVRAAILERVGIGGRVLDYARVLEGMRVDIPIKGTRLKPKLTLPRQAIERIVREAIKRLLMEEAEERLKDVIESRTGEPPAEPKPKPPAGETPTGAEDLLLRSIFDILDEVTKEKKKTRE